MSCRPGTSGPRAGFTLFRAPDRLGEIHGGRRPRFALNRLDDPPYVKVQTQGEAQVIEEPNVGGRWVEIANEMSLRYLGENGPKYLVPTLNEPRWLFFVKPRTLSSWQGTDWARATSTANGERR